MKLVIIGHLLLIVFSSAISDENSKWHELEILTSVKPEVRLYQPDTKNYVVRPRHFQYKSHFGIIIRKNTTFTLKVTTSAIIEELFFHCLTSSKKGTYNDISLKNHSNSVIQVTTLADCVPMTSISQNVPLRLTIITKNWSRLPIFDTKLITFQSAKEAEDRFYHQVQTYGFAENYYTQMLLSWEDIRILQSKNYSLYLGLRNQADLVQYYDYLLGANRFDNGINEKSGYAQMERTTMFLRTEPCDGEIREKLPDNYDTCEELKNGCYAYSGCAYYAYYSAQWIAIVSDVSEFLNPAKGEDWVLLHEVGHNYNIAPYDVNIVGFGETGEVWNNIYGALYQQKFPVKVFWINDSSSEMKDTVDNYRQGKLLKNWDWRPKLHFFMSIFGFDGTDSALREFHLRHFRHSERRHKYFNNIVPDVLEVFLDLYNVNLLPYLEKVVDQSGIPLVTEDLKLRLLSGHGVMPAIDFGLEPKNLQTASRERDFRFATPLILLPKVPQKYVWVKFSIRSPINLSGVCLYLNNDCHKILGYRFSLRLLADVYSSYILLNINGILYLSDVQYHTIANDLKINLDVRKIHERDVYLPLVHYTVSIFNDDDTLVSQAFFDYKTGLISISEIPESLGVFRLPFGRVDNSRYRFAINETIEVNLEHVKRLVINGKSMMIDKSERILKFIFTPVGIQNKNDVNDFQFIESEVARIRQFVDKYKIDLSGNALCREYLDRYARQLRKFNPSIEFPKDWLDVGKLSNRML